VDLQHINPSNVSTQSRSQNGQNVETTTILKSHSSTPNSEREFIARGRHLYGSSVYTIYKRRPTHGSGGERSISTKRSRSRCIVKSKIVILRIFCVHSGSFSQRAHWGAVLVRESKRPNRPQLSSSIISERVTGLTVLKPVGASLGDGKACHGPGERREHHRPSVRR